MHESPVDIIVPVWNRPVETRRCLAALMATAPDARLIIIDTGSERETEAFLQEVSEALDDRALLLTSGRNRGFVAALNQGLARSDAPWVVCVRPSATVMPGWLEPLLAAAEATPEAGLVVPHFGADGNTSRAVASVAREADHGSLATMLLRRTLYQAIGGFDDDLDGDGLCLVDYSRRALKAGFLTCRATCSRVIAGDEPRFGSTERRAELTARSRELVAGRHGVPRSYCLLLPAAAPPEECDALFRLLLRGARRGDRFHVLVPRRSARPVKSAGYAVWHDNITVQYLPLVAGTGAARRALQGLRRGDPGVVAVTPTEAVTAFGIPDVMTLPELERSLAESD